MRPGDLLWVEYRHKKARFRIVWTRDSRSVQKTQAAIQRLANEEPRGPCCHRRAYKSLKSECIRPLTPLTLEDARRLIQTYVDHYNTVRLHSAIGYVTPQDMITGRQAEIHGACDRKLEQARWQGQLRRQSQSFWSIQGSRR